MIIAIQPAYGDARTRRHFAETLDRRVRFAEQPYRQHLSRGQHEELARLHPERQAHFWGGTRSQSGKIAELRQGDLVLLTGQRHLRGVGQIGAVLDNPGLAAALWEPHPRRCSFEIVYSFGWFRRIEIAYGALQAALGTSPRDHFQALRLIRDRRRGDAVRALLDRIL